MQTGACEMLSSLFRMNTPLAATDLSPDDPENPHDGPVFPARYGRRLPLMLFENPQGTKWIRNEDWITAFAAAALYAQ